MPDVKLLNPQLRDALSVYFQQEVRVSNPGLPLEAVGEFSLTARSGHRLVEPYWGETYHVCCNYCNDRRDRLYICHAWGKLHPLTETRNWWLIVCHNENCFASHERRMDLAQKLQLIDTDLFREEPEDRRVLPGGSRLVPVATSTVEDGLSVWQAVLPRSTLPVPTARYVKVDTDNSEVCVHIARSSCQWPGRCEPLNRLYSSHLACQYLRNRGFDPEVIAQTYQVRYCASSDVYPMALNRLVVPIFRDGKMIGWQARCMTGISKVKYYTMPGFSKSRHLYNFDLAKASTLDPETQEQIQPVVLVEGVIDVWSAGPCAVASFGKHVSPSQAALLVNTWPEHVVVALDADASSSAASVCRRLTTMGVKRVTQLSLPHGEDPGSLGSTRFQVEFLQPALQS